MFPWECEDASSTGTQGAQFSMVAPWTGESIESNPVLPSFSSRWKTDRGTSTLRATESKNCPMDELCPSLSTGDAITHSVPQEAEALTLPARAFPTNVVSPDDVPTVQRTLAAGVHSEFCGTYVPVNRTTSSGRSRRACNGCSRVDPGTRQIGARLP